MSKAKDTESYPWDAVWEYILDDKNFEEPQQNKISWAKQRRKLKSDVPSDSDSAYESDEFRQKREIEFKQKLAAAIPVQSCEPDKPKNRFGWLRRRRQKGKGGPEQERIAEIPRQKIRKKEEEQDRRSDFDTIRTLSAVRNRRDDDSVSGYRSVTSTSSVFNLLKWGKKKEDIGNDEGFDFSDDGSLSDEVSVMESIFNFHETRADFDADSQENHVMT